MIRRESHVNVEGIISSYQRLLQLRLFENIPLMMKSWRNCSASDRRECGEIHLHSIIPIAVIAISASGLAVSFACMTANMSASSSTVIAQHS